MQTLSMHAIAEDWSIVNLEEIVKGEPQSQARKSENISENMLLVR